MKYYVLGIWTGGSNESWFPYDKMSRYRVLVNPETQSKLSQTLKDSFYLLSVDVGRLSCQTVVTVLKVKPSVAGFNYNIVNIYVLGTTQETKHFERQALDLKKIIDAFKPREVVIDGNGLIKTSPILSRDNLKSPLIAGKSRWG